MVPENTNGSKLDENEKRQLIAENEQLKKELDFVLWALNSSSWKWNYLTGYVEFSESKANSIGYTRDELRPHYESFANKIHPDDFYHVNQAIDDLLKNKSTVFEVSYRLKSKGGDYVWLHDKGRVLSVQENGDPLLIEGVTIEITKIKQLEEALGKSEKQFEVFFNSNPSSTFVWKMSGGKLLLDEVNSAALEATKNDAKNYIGVSADLIYEHIPLVVEKLYECYRNKTSITFETHYLSKSTGNLECIDYKYVNQPDDYVLMYADIITTRKKVEQVLQESEARSKALLEAIPDLMFRLSRTGDYLDYSAPDYMLMVEGDQILGKNIADIMPKEVVDQSLHYIDKALETNEMQVFEYELDIPGKGYSYFEARIMPSVNEEVITIIRDVTVQMESLNALAESEEKFRLIAENTSDAVLILDGETQRITYASPSIFNITGYTPEEELNRGANEISRLIHPEDQNGIFELIYSAIESNLDNLIYTYRMFHKDGHVIWRQDSARFIYDERGKHLHSYIVARDITKQKEEEEELIKLRTAIEQSSAGIIITDGRGNIEYANAGVTKMTGYNSEELIGQNPNILSGGKHSDDFYKELWDKISNGENWSGEFNNKKKNGELYWENSTISPIKNEKGEIIHYVGIKEDISELKKLIEELKIAKDKAEESDRLKTAFLTNMSHEIRTPMNAMVGFSTLVSTKKLSEEKLGKYSKLISQNATQLLNVINDILDISKIEANQVELFIVDMDVNQELNDIKHFAATKIDESKKKINLKVLCCQEQLTIKTDIVRFKQIMMILIVNAIKFTDRGQIKFGYKLDDKRIVFFVKDTGLGIPVSMHATIFERFKQAKHEDGTFFGGTGLGLSIAKTYTEMLGGTIWLESEEGKGTTFYFTLPVYS